MARTIVKADHLSKVWWKYVRLSSEMHDGQDCHFLQMCEPPQAQLVN